MCNLALLYSIVTKTTAHLVGLCRVVPLKGHADKVVQTFAARKAAQAAVQGDTNASFGVCNKFIILHTTHLPIMYACAFNTHEAQNSRLAKTTHICIHTLRTQRKTLGGQLLNSEPRGETNASFGVCNKFIILHTTHLPIMYACAFNVS